jgi:hypothetical protein
MSTGSGVIYGTSTRQKINTKSSTEGELVAVNDVLPQILWTKYFLEAQGYSANDLVKYQDNKSTMLLEKNSKRTRHLNIQYFFIADRIQSKEVKIEYCPTNDMVADFFSKPLQASLFQKFRDFIMNIPSSVSLVNHDSSSFHLQNHRSVLKPDEPDTGWIVYTKK